MFYDMCTLDIVLCAFSAYLLARGYHRPRRREFQLRGMNLLCLQYGSVSLFCKQTSAVGSFQPACGCIQPRCNPNNIAPLSTEAPQFFNSKGSDSIYAQTYRKLWHSELHFRFLEMSTSNISLLPILIYYASDSNPLGYIDALCFLYSHQLYHH